ALPFYGVEDVTGSTRFVVLHGRPPGRRGEVLLGPDTAKTFGVGVGDRIEIGSGGRFTVVGLGLLPTTPHSSFDQGGWLLPDDIGAATPPELRAQVIPPPPSSSTSSASSPTSLDDARLRRQLFEIGTVVARFPPGVDVRAATARLARAAGPTVAIAAASEPAD